MAYNGDNSYERQIYDKLVEAGFSDEDANLLFHTWLRSQEGGYVDYRSSWQRLKEKLGL